MSTITDAGFVRTRLDERLAALKTSMLAIFGADLDLEPETIDGQFLGVFAEAIADLDELAEAVYNGRSPAGARGAGLARLVQLNGVTKKAAQYSTATVTLSGTAGTVIPAGSLVTSAADSTVVFETIAEYTLSPGRTVAATMRGTKTGPLRAPAGVLTVVTTVISGWTTAINATDATVGTDEETDATLRLRRAASVALPSQGIIDGLYAALVQVPDVAHAKVWENPTDAVDANGLPRHSIQVIVDGGDPAAIGFAIWLKKSVGVTQVGAVEETITDLQGIPHVMKFDRPTSAAIWITIEMTVTPGVDTQALIQNEIVAWGEANSDIGTDVIWSQLFIPINKIPGLDVVNLFVGLAASPTLQANVVIPYNAIADWDTSRILFVDV